jgi:hypothetical protein
VENEGRLSPPAHCPTLTRNGFPPPPPCLCGSPGNSFEPFFLFSPVLPFFFGVVNLLPHHILWQGDPPWVAMHTSKTLQHECNWRQKW